MTGRQLHRSGAMALAVLMALIGAALLVEAVGGRGGGVLSGRSLLGVLFIAAGAGRLYIEVHRGAGR
jgi:hypothetical protein